MPSSVEHASVSNRLDILTSIASSQHFNIFLYSPSTTSSFVSAAIDSGSSHSFAVHPHPHTSHPLLSPPPPYFQIASDPPPPYHQSNTTNNHER
ncbi:hypothetical protein CROQUDRAFT_666665 [Cronartium quercuum f. sp. fusiforme G11]|uniref:Uncharacterized protein n=1 Tax=Cronartium quercuum f. sp. fusiforme G11 TaxID=708437 RepID=A0A9P6N8K7_9BASI|nr:hypothetical protein CROQUDRAFT_666665 [Cronartium quercuum f. sp. fusiforme G11]